MDESLSDLFSKLAAHDKHQNGYISVAHFREVLGDSGALPAQIEGFISQFVYRCVLPSTALHYPSRSSLQDSGRMASRSGSCSPSPSAAAAIPPQERNGETRVTDVVQYVKFMEYFRMVAVFPAFACDAAGLPSLVTRNRSPMQEKTEREEGIRWRKCSPLVRSCCEPGMGERGPYHTATDCVADVTLNGPSRSSAPPSPLSSSPSLSPISRRSSSTVPSTDAIISKHSSTRANEGETLRTLPSTGQVKSRWAYPFLSTITLHHAVRYAAAHPSCPALFASVTSPLPSSSPVSLSCPRPSEAPMNHVEKWQGEGVLTSLTSPPSPFSRCRQKTGQAASTTRMMETMIRLAKTKGVMCTGASIPKEKEDVYRTPCDCPCKAEEGDITKREASPPACMDSHHHTTSVSSRSLSTMGGTTGTTSPLSDHLSSSLSSSRLFSHDTLTSAPTHALLSLHEVYAMLESECHASFSCPTTGTSCCPRTVSLLEMYHVWKCRGLSLSWWELEAIAESLEDRTTLVEATTPLRGVPNVDSRTEMKTAAGKKSNAVKEEEEASMEEEAACRCRHQRIPVEAFCLLVSRLRPEIVKKIRSPAFWQRSMEEEKHVQHSRCETLEEDHSISPACDPLLQTPTGSAVPFSSCFPHCRRASRRRNSRSRSCSSCRTGRGGDREEERHDNVPETVSETVVHHFPIKEDTSREGEGEDTTQETRARHPLPFSAAASTTTTTSSEPEPSLSGEEGLTISHGIALTRSPSPRHGDAQHDGGLCCTTEKQASHSSLLLPSPPTLQRSSSPPPRPPLAPPTYASRVPLAHVLPLVNGTSRKHAPHRPPRSIKRTMRTSTSTTTSPHRPQAFTDSVSCIRIGGPLPRPRAVGKRFTCTPPQTAQEEPHVACPAKQTTALAGGGKDLPSVQDRPETHDIPQVPPTCGPSAPPLYGPPPPPNVLHAREPSSPEWVRLQEPRKENEVQGEAAERTATKDFASSSLRVASTSSLSFPLSSSPSSLSFPDDTGTWHTRDAMSLSQQPSSPSPSPVYPTGARQHTARTPSCLFSMGRPPLTSPCARGPHSEYGTPLVARTEPSPSPTAAGGMSMPAGPFLDGPHSTSTSVVLRIILQALHERCPEYFSSLLHPSPSSSPPLLREDFPVSQVIQIVLEKFPTWTVKEASNVLRWLLPLWSLPVLPSPRTSLSACPWLPSAIPLQKECHLVSDAMPSPPSLLSSTPLRSVEADGETSATPLHDDHVGPHG